MNYFKITKHDIANGPGVRCVLWVAGCTVHCKECQNQITWGFDSGIKFTYETLYELLKALSPDYIQGLTLSGGHPLEPQNLNICTLICKLVKEFWPHKDIWVYTGYLFEDVKNLEIMKYIDVLVDGPFIIEQKDISLAFCGSTNQRVIDVQASLSQDKIILWNEGD